MSDEVQTRSGAQALYPEAQPEGDSKADAPANDQTKAAPPDTVPESWQEYDLGLAPEADQHLLMSFKQAAHQNGLTANQAAQLAKWYRSASIPGAQDPELALIKTEQALKQEWGPRFSRYLELANQAVVRFGGGELIQAMKQSGVGLDPAMVRAWAQVGAALGEDSFVQGASGGAPKRSLAEILYDHS